MSLLRSPDLVLASASPRRAELLERAGYTFDVIPADLDEARRHGESPRDYVVRIAVEKMSMVARDRPERIVVGADTVVVIGTVLLGKPKDAAEATRMLRRLSGRTHRVLTGVAVGQRGRCVTGVEVTRVQLIDLDDATIDRYVGTGEPLDKAGAYGIQGIASRFVARIDGSYSNVVGLPLTLVDRLLPALGQPAVSR